MDEREAGRSRPLVCVTDGRTHIRRLLREMLGEYSLTVRATGQNTSGQTVTHLYPIKFDVATAGTSGDYVDIMGFTVFRIASVNSNDVMGYAITPVIADMNDPRLSHGQVAKLVPWN